MTSYRLPWIVKYTRGTANCVPLSLYQSSREPWSLRWCTAPINSAYSKRWVLCSHGKASNDIAGWCKRQLTVAMSAKFATNMSNKISATSSVRYFYNYLYFPLNLADFLDFYQFSKLLSPFLLIRLLIRQTRSPRLNESQNICLAFYKLDAGNELRSYSEDYIYKYFTNIFVHFWTSLSSYWA